VELGNDPCKPTITVRKSADTSSAKPRVTTTKTGQERSVRIGARTTEVLKSHRPRQPKERRMAAKSWADPGLVFPNTLGAIGRRHYLMESYRRLLKAPGLPSDIRFHHLRHTSARAWAPSCSLQQDARPHRPGDDLEALGPRP
jgi:integrase